MRRLCKQMCLFGLLAIPLTSPTQQVNGKRPEDPKQFLADAAKVNGLASEKLGPWHAKANFQILDDHGNSSESGIFESFWESPDQFKMIYTSPSYSRTIWANESGHFATTDPRWPGQIEWMVRRSLFDLVMEPRLARKAALEWRDVSTGTQVSCIDEIYTVRLPQVNPFYCFDSVLPVIRFSSEGGRYYQATFNNIVDVHGAYVARDVELLHEGKPYFRLHLDTLEALPKSGEDTFRPDAAARPVARRMVIDSDLRDMHPTFMTSIPNSTSAILNGLYPKARIPAATVTPDREVIVQVLVNKKGKVADARVVKGDPFRQAGALGAARSWEFKPYIVQGEPMEFYTELEFF